MPNEVLSRPEAHEGPGGAELTRAEAAAASDRAPAAAASLKPVTLGRLFWVFFVLGATSFGGGVVAYLRQALVVRERWLDDESFLSGLELSQTLPGLNATNMSIYMGERLRGIPGALVALLGMCLPGNVKIKEELLLVGTELGGMRSVFSHTCQIKNQSMNLGTTLGEWAKIFPAVLGSGVAPGARIAPVSKVGVEEVLFDLGIIHFGGGRNAKVNLAVWRERETQRVLIGEFAFETGFKHYGRLHPRPKHRSERLYRLLQRETGAWVELGTTKTKLAYALSGKKLDHDE